MKKYSNNTPSPISKNTSKKLIIFVRALIIFFHPYKRTLQARHVDIAALAAMHVASMDAAQALAAPALSVTVDKVPPVPPTPPMPPYLTPYPTPYSAPSPTPYLTLYNLAPCLNHHLKKKHL